MKKRKNNFVKEIFIFILLLILILLILAVVLYDFVPSNVTVAEVKEYSSDAATTSIKQEIAYSNGGLNAEDTTGTAGELVTSLKSYNIDAADLHVYDEKNLYNKGNSNPFSYVAEETQNTTNTTNTATGGNGNGGTVNSGNTTATQGTSNSSSTGTFFESDTHK